MKRLEGKVYYDTDEAQQDMMVFNKMFWGVYGYTHPKLYKNNVDDLWIIRF
ncbi:MAG: hypothetical protein J6U54_08505 [Clostridiales bacterium]|nr:hypothetical protein [Clostridiales bacterium]